MRKTLTIIASIALTTNSINAQETSLTSGGDYTSTNGSISFSLGQTLYTTNNSLSNQENQGIQHSYETFSISNLGENRFNSQITIYPNPTTNFITFESKENLNNFNHYELYNFLGKIIKTHKITNNKTILDFQDLPRGPYILSIINKKKETQSFNIIKN